MSRTRPRGGASRVAAPLDETVGGGAAERGVLPWLRAPIGPDTAGSISDASAGNDEAAGRGPREPCDGSNTAGRGNTALAGTVEAQKQWGRKQQNCSPARQQPRPVGERLQRSRPARVEGKQTGRVNAAHSLRGLSVGGCLLSGAVDHVPR